MHSSTTDAHNASGIMMGAPQSGRFQNQRVEDPGSLVGLTHLPGTPWDLARKQCGKVIGDDSDIPITQDSLKDWFSRELRQGLQAKSNVSQDDLEARWAALAA